MDLLKTITKEQYLQCRKDLLFLAHCYGYQVKTYYRQSEESYCKAQQCYFSKVITLEIFGKNNYIEALFQFAHEVRHAEHVYKGKYASFYSKQFRDLWQRVYSLKPIDISKIPKRSVAIKAERDCNKWAEAWLRKHGIDPGYHKPYSSRNTVVSYLWRYLITHYYAVSWHTWKPKNPPKTKK